jgi:hypothetical protein
MLQSPYGYTEKPCKIIQEYYSDGCKQSERSMRHSSLAMFQESSAIILAAASDLSFYSRNLFIHYRNIALETIYSNPKKIHNWESIIEMICGYSDEYVSFFYEKSKNKLYFQEFDVVLCYNISAGF